MSIPGIHVAVHTDQVLLSTGAWMDFSQHVHTLLLDGKDEEARTLWDSVFEVVHMGVDPSTPVLQSPDMPPIRRMPCCKTPCARCENRRGGFQFPFIGTWTHRAVFAQEALSVASNWDRYHAHPHETLDLVAVQMYASGHSVQEAKLSDRLARGDDGVSQSYTSLPWGVSGRTGQLCGMSQSSSWQTSRDLSTRLGDSYGCCCMGAEAAEVEFIPPISPSCGTHWCDDCRRPCVGTAPMEKHNKHLVALGNSRV
jgi:hypothetical protein